MKLYLHLSSSTLSSFNFQFGKFIKEEKHFGEIELTKHVFIWFSVEQDKVISPWLGDTE